MGRQARAGENYELRINERLENPQSAVEFQLPDKQANDKQILLEMTLSACGKQGKRLYTAIIRDITGLRRATPVPVQIGLAA